MALNRTSPSSNGEKKDLKYTNAPEGENEARLLYVADLGIQRKEYQGKHIGDFRQYALGLEFVGQYVEINDEKVPRLLWTKPFYVYDKMDEKGTELKYYKAFDPTATDATIPDWEAQLGKPCNAIVVHVNGKGDKAKNVYDNISGLTSIPSKYQDNVPPMEMKPSVGEEAIKALHGLAKIVYDRRLDTTPAKEEKPTNFDDFDQDALF